MSCFDELQLKRDPNVMVQKHCILICNSPPYLIPVFECQTYSGKNAEQLAGLLQEVYNATLLFTQIFQFFVTEKHPFIDYISQKNSPAI